MTIGPDIKEAITEVGVSFTVIRDSGNVDGGYLIFKPNAQVTKPFIREFFLEAQMAYDTPTVNGDIIEFNTTSNRYMVMNFTPKLFEDTIISYDTVLYKTNVQVNVLRPSDIRDPQTYLMRTVWTAIQENRDLLLTTPLFGQDMETDQMLGNLAISNHEIWAPSALGIQLLDRIKVLGQSDEYYRVEAVRKRRFESIDVVKVGEDVRPTTSSSTTTTTITTTTTTMTSTTVTTSSSTTTTTTA
jgi:hypothetical protein